MIKRLLDFIQEKFADKDKSFARRTFDCVDMIYDKQLNEY